MRRLKRLVVALAIVVVALVITRFALDHIGAGALDAIEPDLARAIAAEHARILAIRFPAPQEGSTDEDAAPALTKVFGAASKWRKDLDVRWLAHAPIPPSASAFLAAHAADLDALHRAARSTRCDWKSDIATGMDGPIIDILGARTCDTLLRLDGMARLADNDARGAVANELVVARLGVMVGAAPSLHESLTGHGLVGSAWGKLADIVTSTALPAATLQRIDAEVVALAPFVPADADAVRSERLRSVSSIRHLGASGGVVGALVPMAHPIAYDNVSQVAIDVTVPQRYALGCAARELWDLYGALERGVAAGRAESIAAGAEYERRVEATWNPMTRLVAASLAGCAYTTAHFQAKERLLRLAIAIELKRGADGRYPATLADSDIPEDPSAAPARLRYEALDGGARYRIASVGEDGKPGTSGSIKLERALPR